MQKITLAGGCFWCIEAVFKRLNGVEAVQSGYASGSEKDSTAPSYEQVASRQTNFAEAVQIEFDPGKITTQKLLEVFWAVHDPTTLDRQGHDVGPEYRSAIFYSDAAQKELAEQSIAALAASKKYSDPIVTVVEPLAHFYPAEKEHSDFYDRNRGQAYCRLVIDPKIQKLYKGFQADLKPGTGV